MLGVRRHQSDLTHQSGTRSTNYRELNMSNSKLCPKKFLTYTKAFRLQCIFTNPNGHSKSLLSRRNHQQLSRSTFNSSTVELFPLSQSEILSGMNAEYEESDRKTMIKCADWLMKYVFNPNVKKKNS